VLDGATAQLDLDMQLQPAQLVLHLAARLDETGGGLLLRPARGDHPTIFAGLRNAIKCNSAHFSQDCNGGSYQTITSFVADLFRNGGDGILQSQDGSPDQRPVVRTRRRARQGTARPASASPVPDIGQHTSHRNSA
jgi:hypothetical protein